MSIQEQTIEIISKEPEQLSISTTSRKRWYSVLYSPLWLCLLVALIVRIVLVIHTHGVIDGDEAVVGIQAQHILHGEWPIYFYGQSYMGSAEAYLMALLFAIAGSSVWTLRAEPILLSLVVVWLSWKLAAALAKAAQLPPSTQRLFQTIVALGAAVPPLYDTVAELRTLGGYVETFILMLLLLLSTVRLTQRWREGASSRELALRWAGLGLIVGLGLWIDFLLISAILASTVWIIGHCLVEIIRLKREAAISFLQSVLSVFKKLLLVISVIPTCFIGCTPAIYWGATNQWQNVTHMLHISNDLSSVDPQIRRHYPNRLGFMRGMVKVYTTRIGPRLVGGALPFERPGLSTILHWCTLTLGAFCLLAVIALVTLSFIHKHPLLLQVRQLTLLPLIFAAFTAYFFCTSPAAFIALDPVNDVAGRYATPLMLALPFFFAAIFVAISMHLHEYRKKRAQNAGGEQSTLQISSSPMPSYRRLGRLAQSVLLAVLLAGLYAQATTYALADADLTFLSPYCSKAPANIDPIIAYLQHEHVHDVWTSEWIGYPMAFKTQESIIFASPRYYITGLGLNRLPADYNAVVHADRPALLAFVKHNDSHPQLLRILDAMHITYHSMRFPAEQGFDVLAIIPLNRSIPLRASKSFASIFYPTCNQIT